MRYEPVPAGMNGRCAEHCTDGHACGLRADVPHTLHICTNPRCPCHSRSRYQPGWAEPERNGRAKDYTPTMEKRHQHGNR